MRSAFPYENDASLLKNILVPKWIPLAQWEATIHSKPPEQSLLQWLVGTEWCEEETLIEHLLELCELTDSHPWNPVPQTPQGAEERILTDNGFYLLGSQQVCGGPYLPPDLHAFIGEGCRHWQWCFVLPTDREEKSSKSGQRLRSKKQSPCLENALQSILWEALARGAHDIHFERSASHLDIRASINGALVRLGRWSDPVSERWMRMLKQACGMQLDGNILPEDGRLELGGTTETVSMRAGRIPTIDGESLVLRLTDAAQALPTLEMLGLPESLRWALYDTLFNDPGLVLFTGITGSGKTTTACAFLKEYAHANLKIVTIEDPIEYVLQGVQQSAVDLPSGWTFEAALKAYLRQDPDAIFIGEIRDADSARIACRAALTGHCVLGTLHAGSRSVVLDRLKAWGIPDGLLKETLRVVIHQSLDYDPILKRHQARFSWQIAEQAMISK